MGFRFLIEDPIAHLADQREQAQRQADASGTNARRQYYRGSVAAYERAIEVIDASQRAEAGGGVHVEMRDTDEILEERLTSEQSS